MNSLKINMQALNCQRQFGITDHLLEKNTEKLSSGYKINRAADDAAGLSISEKMRKQIRGLSKASENIEDGISLVQVADGALSETEEILQRMNELAVKAANGTNSEIDRGYIQDEITQSVKEIDRIANTTTFNKDIYPLAAKIALEGSNSITTKKLPTGMSLQNVTITNNVTDPVVTINGTTINFGDSITIPNVLVTNTANFYSASGDIIRYDYYEYDTPSSMMKLYTTYSIAQNTSYNTSELLNISSRVHDLTQIQFNTIDDLQEDENGYLYTTFHKMSFSRQYIGKLGGTQSSTALSIADSEAYKLYRYDLETTNAPLKSPLLYLQTGAESYDGMNICLADMTASTLGIKDLSVQTEDSATNAISTIGDAIKKVSSTRSRFGAYQNRLEHAKKINDNTGENLQYAESIIRDTDMAKEMVAYSNHNILSQAGQSMLSQANQQKDYLVNLISA